MLFQILAYNVLLKRGYKLSFVDTLTKRNLITKIGGWTVHQNLFHDLLKTSTIHEFNSLYSIAIVVVGFLSKKVGKIFDFSGFFLNDADLSRSLPKNIFGYFQDKGFLSRNIEEINELASRLRLKYKIEGSYHVVVHFRKGDSGWVDNNYYTRVKERLQHETDPITIVTDSPDNARSFFSDVSDCEIIRSPDALKDFAILLSGSKLYCAPSTFSWWAAHALDESSTVVFPAFLDERLGIYTRCNYIIV